MKKETEDYQSRCSAEAKKMLEDVQLADHDLDSMEREAADVLKVISGFLFFLKLARYPHKFHSFSHMYANNHFENVTCLY